MHLTLNYMTLYLFKCEKALHCPVLAVFSLFWAFAPGFNSLCAPVVSQRNGNVYIPITKYGKYLTTEWSALIATVQQP